MNLPTQQKVTDELAFEEKLLWCGQPSGGIRWYLIDVIEIPFSIIWLCGVTYINYQIFTWDMPLIVSIIFRTFGSIFFCFGIFFVMRKFIDKWNRERTYYGLSDRNIIIVSDFVQKRVNKFALHELGEVKLIPQDEIHGTIDFGLDRYKYLRFNTPSMNFRVPVKLPFLPGESGACYRFESIENAATVYRQIEEATSKHGEVTTMASFPDSPTSLPRERRFAYLAVILPIIGIAVAGPHLIKFSQEMIQSFQKHNQPAKQVRSDDICVQWLDGLKAGDFVAQARNRHQEYVNLSPEEAHAKGLEHDRRREYADAICAWECEVARKPDSQDGWNDIGYAYQELNNPERAYEYAAKAIAINPRFGHGHYTAGRALLIMGRYSEAKDELQKAIRDGWQQGGDSEMLLGLALSGMGDETRAAAAFRRSLAIRPNYAQTGRYLAGEKFIPTWAKCRER